MEEKRRLPSWMIGASTANKVSKTLDPDPNDIITENSKTKSTKPKAKVLTRKHKKEVDDKSLLVKCETKRKKRRTIEEDVTESHSFKQDVIVEKKKLRRVNQKVEEPDLSRKKEENTTQSSDEEDEDLTMEDLLSIAKQFVENDKSDTGQQKSREGHKRNSKNSSSVNNISLNAPQNTNQEETTLHNESIENTRSEITLEANPMTDDPAQDMLDLFLGPLLKKPIQKEERSSIKDMIVTHEVKNQQHDAVVFEKPVTFTKKKSSLRDAVAMLLD